MSTRQTLAGSVDFGLLDWRSFTSLCNSLLVAEVSPLIKTYDAPGRDSGKDAEWENGEYEQLRGRFVFQYKFFDPRKSDDENRSSLLGKLKGSRQEKGELEKAAEANAEVLFLLTNISLTSGTRQKIQDLKAEKGYTYAIEAWDGSDIRAHLARHPYLVTYHFPVAEPAFELWRDRFCQELQPGSRGPWRFNLPCHGRDDELNTFRQFMADDQPMVLLVSGPGGIGKTRFLIRLAELAEQEFSPYQVRFVRTESQDLSQHLNEIPPGHSYLLLADDAFDLSPANMSVLRSLIVGRAREEQVKLVLAVRQPLKEAVERILFARAVATEITSLTLGPLPQAAMRRLIAEELPEAPDQDRRIMERLGRDTPFLAVMAMDVYRAGISLGGLTEENIVQKAFELYLEEVQGDDAQSKRRLLEWMAGIVPFALKQEPILQRLAELLGTTPPGVLRWIDELREAGFVTVRGLRRVTRIFPDLLGEYLFKRQCFLRNGTPTGKHIEYLTGFLWIATKEVLLNLARLESKHGEADLLGEFFFGLKRNVGQYDNEMRLHWIEALSPLCYVRPWDVLEVFEQILDTPQEPVEVKGWFGLPHQLAHEDLIPRMVDQLRNTVYDLEAQRRTLELLRRISEVPGVRYSAGRDPGSLLREVLGFQIRKPIAYQLQALEQLRGWITHAAA